MTKACFNDLRRRVTGLSAVRWAQRFRNTHSDRIMTSRSTRQRFVIICQARSGSTLLEHSLNSHPEIICHGEVLSRGWINGLIPVDNVSLKRSPRDVVESLLPLKSQNFERFLEEYVWNFDYPAIGFKIVLEDIFLSDNRDKYLQYFQSRDIVPIILYRHDQFASYVSAHRMGHFKIRHMESIPGADHKMDKSYVEAVDALFETREDSAAGGEDAYTPLHWAAVMDHIDAVDALLEAGADPDARSGVGYTPLHWAAVMGYVDIVDKLLKAGADPDGGGKDTPLHWAAGKGHPRVVGMLLEAGADPVAEGQDGHTPLQWAAAKRRIKVVDALLEAGAGPYAPPHVAVDKSYVEAVDAVFTAVTNPVAGGEDGYTPLHWAAVMDHIDAVDALLKAGADPNAPNGPGDTPLYWAAGKGRVRVVDMLLKAGADPNARNGLGYTPLHWAAVTGRLEVVDALLKAGAKPNARNGLGYTPLHWAAVTGLFEVVDALLKAGADSNARNGCASTPLHWAAGKGYLRVIDALLEAGANPGARNDFGNTPLHVAATKLETPKLSIDKQDLRKFIEKQKHYLKSVVDLLDNPLKISYEEIFLQYPRLLERLGVANLAFEEKLEKSSPSDIGAMIENADEIMEEMDVFLQV